MHSRRLTSKCGPVRHLHLDTLRSKRTYVLTSWQELKRRDRERDELLDQLQALKTRAAEVDRLQEENESLKAELRRHRQGPEEEPAPSLGGRTALGELSPNKSTSRHHVPPHKAQPGDETSEAATKYAKLFAESKKLKSKHEDALKKLRGYREKLRERSEAVNEWAKISDLQQQTIQKLKIKLKALPSATDCPTAQASRPIDTASADDESLAYVIPKGPSPDPSLEDEQALSPRPMDASPSPPKEEPVKPPLHFAADDVSADGNDHVYFEDNTAADELDLPPHPKPAAESPLMIVNAEPSSDVPVVISARTLRKRKYDRDEAENTRVQRIKLEHSSSSGPEVVAEANHLSPAESIDFDEEVHVPTPRKRRARLYTDSEGTPLPKTAGMPSFETSRTPNKPDRSRVPLHQSLIPRPPLDTPSAPHDTLSHMPGSVSITNTVKLASTTPRVSHLNLGVMDLAEDGDGGSNTLQSPKPRGRLDALLNKLIAQPALTPVKRAPFRELKTPQAILFEHGDVAAKLPPSRVLSSAGISKSREAATPVNKRQPELATSSLPTVVRDRGPKKPSILRDDMPRGRSVARDDTPLRERPIERLRPEDFKPNPKYNDGLTYVYDEVVRGKEARAALSGCTDLNCCGKTFRRFAEAERKDVGSSITTRAEDITLMEKYLGDRAWQLGTMVREEKDETWLLAKTWELANKFGRHRQRYSRMVTPPGFWNVDFPSTQERAEERRQAEAIRNALVRERYMEAMRYGGSWLFRDEEPR